MCFSSVSIQVSHLCILMSVLLIINFYDFKRVYYELVTATIILQTKPLYNSLAHRSMLLLIASVVSNSLQPHGL